jgi:hypothetical protein
MSACYLSVQMLRCKKNVPITTKQLGNNRNYMELPVGVGGLRAAGGCAPFQFHWVRLVFWFPLRYVGRPDLS